MGVNISFGSVSLAMARLWEMFEEPHSSQRSACWLGENASAILWILAGHLDSPQPVLTVRRCLLYNVSVASVLSPF